MEVQKIKPSQDALYRFLLEHDVKVSRLAELMCLQIKGIKFLLFVFL